MGISPLEASFQALSEAHKIIELIFMGSAHLKALTLKSKIKKKQNFTWAIFYLWLLKRQISLFDETSQ